MVADNNITCTYGIHTNIRNIVITIYIHAYNNNNVHVYTGEVNNIMYYTGIYHVDNMTI